MGGGRGEEGEVLGEWQRGGGGSSTHPHITAHRAIPHALGNKEFAHLARMVSDLCVDPLPFCLPLI